MNSKTYHITLNGKVYEVEIEEVKKIEKVDNNKEKPAQVIQNKTNSKEVVEAPMPGTIVNILVSKGETVKKGQVLAILEAMKMENEIVAPIDGQVVSVNIEKGQNVNLGDSLVQIG